MISSICLGVTFYIGLTLAVGTQSWWPIILWIWLVVIPIILTAKRKQDDKVF